MSEESFHVDDEFGRDLVEIDVNASKILEYSPEEYEARVLKGGITGPVVPRDLAEMIVGALRQADRAGAP